MEAREYAVMFAMESRHWWFRASRTILLDILGRHAPAPRGDAPLRLLDLGCGTGITLDRIGRADGIRTYGLDFERDALAFCRARGLARLVQGSMMATPFRDGGFDLVLALDVIEHVDDDGAALREVARLLRPGGRLLVTVPAFAWLWSEHDEALHHRRRYTRAELVARLGEAGLRPITASYYNAFLFPPLAAVRMTHRVMEALGRGRPPGSAPKSDVALPPAPANALLGKLFELERFWLRYARFPFGASVVAVAER